RQYGSEIKYEAEVRHCARAKCEGGDGSAGGYSRVRRNVEALSPHHDPSHFAAIKMRHRVDVSRIINAALQRHCRLFIRPAWYLFNCHGYRINWITGFVRIIQQISLPSMANAVPDVVNEKQVILRLRSRKSANALREITQLLAQNGKIVNAERFLEQVLAREHAHPSVVEHGVAFPH